MKGQVFTKNCNIQVAVSYSETCESQYKSSVEEFIGSSIVVVVAFKVSCYSASDCLEPCYNCQSSTLVNCILVQVGLIKVSRACTFMHTSSRSCFLLSQRTRNSSQQRRLKVPCELCSILLENHTSVIKEIVL